MAIAQRKTQSLRASRIASLKSKIRSKQVEKKVASVKKFASLAHFLNATALYQMGHYQRASLAFQKAMAEEDAPEMLEHLESQMPVTDGVHCEVEDEDYLSGDLSEPAEDEDHGEASLDDMNDDLEIDTEDDLSDPSQGDQSQDGLVVDEASSQDVLDGNKDDFSVDEDEVDDTDEEVFSVKSKAESNLKALSNK